MVWFGKYTDIASLVLLFGFTQPIAFEIEIGIGIWHLAFMLAAPC